MGFEVARFPDQQVPTHLRCLLCNLVLQQPLQTPDCEHPFCSVCIQQWLQTSSICPHHGQEDDNISVKSETKGKSPLRKMSFRKIIGKSSSKDNSTKDQTAKLPQIRLEDLKQLPSTVLDELNALKIRCQFADNGCTELITIGELTEHIQKCSHATDDDTSVVKSVVADAVQRVSGDEESANEQRSVQSTASGPEADGSECTGSEASKSRKGSCVSDDREEVGSDGFVVVAKNDAESIGGDVPSDKAVVDPDDKTTEKKKKKKKKKKSAKKEDDVNSQKDDSATNSEEERKLNRSDNSSGSNQSDSELIKRLDALQQRITELEAEKSRDEEKFENLRSVNVQLLTQIKQLQQNQQQEQNQQTEVDRKQLQDLQDQLNTLRIQNERQERQIESLSSINTQYGQLVLAMRNQELEAKDRFANTISQFNQVLQTIRSVKA